MHPVPLGFIYMEKRHVNAKQNSCSSSIISIVGDKDWMPLAQSHERPVICWQPAVIYEYIQNPTTSCPDLTLQVTSKACRKWLTQNIHWQHIEIKINYSIGNNDLRFFNSCQKINKNELQSVKWTNAKWL